MDLPVPLPWALAALVVALLLVLAGVWLAGLWASFASRARNRVAIDGEAEAEAILRADGYRVVGRQVAASWAMAIDGVDVSIGVRADLIVERDGQRYVAEVKTGERAPDPCYPQTRRQLLEYALVFDAREVLLVDVAARAVRAVAFPLARALPRRGESAVTTSGRSRMQRVSARG